jgi:hypothetical protein
MQMLRIEHVKDRVGAYASAVNINWCEDGGVGVKWVTAITVAMKDCDEQYDMDRQPGPLGDDLLREWWIKADCSTQEQYKFGFADIQQYLNYFHHSPGRKAMSDQWVLAVYETDDWHIGSSQMVAHQDSMDHVHDLCPATMEVI